MNLIQNTPDYSTQSFYSKHKKSNKKGKKHTQRMNTNVSKPQTKPIEPKVQPQYITPEFKPEKAVMDLPVEQVEFNEPEEVVNPDITKTSKSNKYKNALMGSLFAMAAISVPTVIYLDDEPDISHYPRISTVENDNFDDVYCNVEALAQGGEDDAIVEPDEIMQLINYDGVDKLPDSERKAIIDIASIYANSVYVGDEDAKKQVVSQVRKIQGIIDKAVNDSNNPDKIKFNQKSIDDYKREYITGTELVDNLDFSELSKYQDDVTVLKALLHGGMDRIRRDDPNVAEKFDNACENAQHTIDNITNRYKMNARIAGNDNYDNTVSKEEIAGLLNLGSIEQLSPAEQKAILSRALGSYKTISFSELKNKDDIKKINAKVCAELQKVQDKLDSAADKALQRKFNIN